MKYQNIIQQLPYTDPFLFVDELTHIDDISAQGYFTFKKNAYYYQGHFKDNPVTPGVLLTECCAQIGLVSLGIQLLSSSDSLSANGFQIALTSSEMEFYLPVFPDEKVFVKSDKIYFRFQKLKCNVKMYNAENKLVCKGTIAGMFKTSENE
jgi:3-hydroxyacyl-[acyl-carrier-protein] dehydratase